VERQDVERIARATLKELGLAQAELTVAPVDGQPGQWRIDIHGNQQGPGTLKIRCGEGSSPQWVRNQIFDQYTS
jgi:hypothetical protein